MSKLKVTYVAAGKKADAQTRQMSGFTLIEVLCALLIFSVAIIGLTASSAHNTRAAAAMADKSYAGVVADNQLVLARHDDLKLGVQSGDVHIGTQDFTYRVETEPTEIEGFYKLTVWVSLQDTEQVLIERVAFRTFAGAGS